MPLSLTTFKTSNTTYFPPVSGKPSWKLNISANPWDDLMDYLVANCGTLGDPGSNGIVKRTALNVTVAAVAGTDYVVPVTAPTAWTTLTLAAGWTNVGGTLQVAQYMRDAEGFVHLRGSIQGGTLTDGTIIFTLPAGFIPPADTSCIVLINSTSGGARQLLIDSSGNGRVYGLGSATLVDLMIVFSTKP